MVKNNIEVDVKVKCIEQGKTQVQIAKEIDTTKMVMSKKSPKRYVNEKAVKHALGVDSFYVFIGILCRL